MLIVSNKGTGQVNFLDNYVIGLTAFGIAMMKKWTKSEPKMDPKWTKSGQKMIKSGQKIDPKQTKN